ncbi:WhiB family transcriptional regulator [Streptomyces sp. YKOK-I1]
MTHLTDNPDGVLDSRDDWREFANCAGLDSRVFFANGKGSTAQVQQAKRICAACPVRPQCADFAIKTGERWGVWGGMSQVELRRRRRRFTSNTRTATRDAA